MQHSHYDSEDIIHSGSKITENWWSILITVYFSLVPFINRINEIFGNIKCPSGILCC